MSLLSLNYEQTCKGKRFLLPILNICKEKMAEMLLFDGVEIKSLFRVLRAELIASQDGLTTSEIKSCYKTYFGKVTIYTFCLFLDILKLSNGAHPPRAGSVFLITFDLHFLFVLFWLNKQS